MEWYLVLEIKVIFYRGFNMLKLLFLLLLLFSSFSQAESRNAQEKKWLSNAQQAAQKQDWTMSYYYLEDLFASENKEIKTKTNTLIKDYPKITSDYSSETLELCSRTYGKVRCKELTSKRLDLYKIIASIDEISQVEQNIDNFFSSIEFKKENRLFENNKNFGFKNYALGALEKSLVGNDYNWQCNNLENKVLADRVCISRKETIAGVNVSKVSLFFQEDQLVSILVNINSSNYKQVLDALTQKYGASLTTSDNLTNNFGANFSSAKNTWNVDDFRVSISEFFGRLDESGIVYSHKSFTDLFNQRTQKASKNNAKDL